MINRNESKSLYSPYKGWRKLLALLCAFTLLVSSGGVAAFAEEDDDIYSVPVTAPGSTLKHTPSPEGDPEETPAPEEEGIEYAAGTLAAEAGDCFAQIDYPAEARIPEGARLALEAGDGMASYRGLKAAARLVRIDGDEAPGREVAEEGYQFYTLTIVDADGNAVQPAVPVTLSFRKAESPEGVNWLLAGDLPRFLAADQGGISVADYEMEMIGYVRITERPTEPVTLEYAGPDYTVIATYGPDAGFPADTELTVREIKPGTPEYALYSGMTEEALNEEWSEITLERYFDITFISGGVELEPQGNVDVQIVFREAIELTDEHDVSAVHIENNEATVIESETEGAGQDEEAIDKVTFTADSFSVFGVVQRKKIIKKVLAADGQTYEINVEYGPEAEIPEGAELQVVEIEEGSDLWEAYRKQTAAALGASDVRLPGLYDITIIDAEGVAVEPKAPVNVSIRLANADEAEETLHVVHFTEEIPEELVAAAAEEKAEEQAEVQPLAEEDMIASETIADAVTEGDTVTFETDGFSVYAFAYTVDFHYIVDGQRYDFSIPGGGFVTFSQIMELLHIPTARGAVRGSEEQAGEEEHVEAEKVYFIPDIAISEETKNFVNQIESITFSSPKLVSVSKAEETATIGQIKEKLGLKCEYSEELTEKNIEDINAQTVEAGDWVLISVLPFTTEEWLTVTMKDGETFTVKVTDAQIKTTVKSAAGDLYEITVTYNDTAEIPEDAELVVREIMSDEEEYQANVETANHILASVDEPTLLKPVQFDISIVVEGEEIEPREGSIVSVEIKLLPEIFVQRTGEESENKDEPDGAPAVWFYGSKVEDDGELSCEGISVFHLTGDEEGEIIGNVNGSISENNQIVVQFETESFSTYLIDNEHPLANLPAEIFVGDVIYIVNASDIWVKDLWRDIVSETKYNGDGYKTVRAKNVGEFTFTGRNFTPEYKTIKVLPQRTGTRPDPVSTVSNASVGITFNLFDYDIGNYLDDRFNNRDYENDTYGAFWDYGINNGHPLKFLGSGNSNLGINSYTENGINSNIVEDQLVDGYPKLTGGESLSYLFDTSSHDDNVYAYSGADGLFQKIGDNYVYNSNRNYAYYITGENRFEVYGGTYNQKVRQAGGEQAESVSDKKIGFFPFHPYDPDYDLFVNWNKNLNHHFGVSMSVDFSLPTDPKAVTDSKGNPIVFDFSGDDDMWVFIDGQLAMDIGGIHQPISGTINFQDHTVTVAGSVQKNSSDFDAIFANTGTNGINLYDGKKHTLQVFYLERGGCDSNCMISFNLTRYGDLRFTKEGKNQQRLPGAIFGVYKDEGCTELLSEKLKDGTFRDFVAMSDNDGIVEFNDLPLGTYYLKEIYAPNGYELDQKVYRLEVFIGQDGEIETVIVTLDGKVVDADHPFTLTNKNTSVKAVKKWYLKPADGSDPIEITGNPVSVQLYRLKKDLNDNTTGTDVTITTNGGSNPLTLTGDTAICKTGDTIRITATSSKNAEIRMDYRDNIAPFYHGQAAFGHFNVTAGTPKTVLKKIGDGITEVNFGTWSGISAGECTINIQIISRGSSSVLPGEENAVAIGDPITLSSDNNWMVTVSDLPGTDVTDGREYYYFFREVEGGSSPEYYPSVEDGVFVWTIKNYTDEPDGQTVKLRKRDKNSGAAIQGVEFQMFTADPETNPNAEPINITDELIEEWHIKTDQMGASSGPTLVTDSSGRFYSGFLPSNTYYIRETKAKEGYIKDHTVHRIRITSSGMEIWDPDQNQWTPRNPSTGHDYYELYIENEQIPTTELKVLKQWLDVNGQEMNAPEGATVDIVVRRYKLVDTATPGPGPGPEQTGTLTITDGYTGLDDGTAYVATYHVTGNGVDRSGSGTTFAGLPIGTYTVSKTVAAVDGYNITAYETEELTGISVSTAGGTATFHDTVFEQQTTPSGKMNITFRVVYLEGSHTTSLRCTCNPQSQTGHNINQWPWYQQFDFTAQNTGTDEWKATDVDVVDLDGVTIVYPLNGDFDTNTLDPNDVVTITSNAELGGTRTLKSNLNLQHANLTLKAQSGNVVITLTVGPDPNSGAAGYTANRSWPDWLIGSALADDVDIYIGSEAPNLPTIPDKEWMPDTTWSETITLTGPWSETITVDGKDEDGNLYVYYIDTVSENGIPNPGNWRVVKDGQIVWGDHDTNTDHSGDTLSVTNKVTQIDHIPTPVDIPIKKIDETNEPLPNIAFGVFAQDEDTDPLGTATTGSDGTATLTIPATSTGTHGGVNDNETEKTFILKETTPEGYASESPWIVTIKAAGAHATATTVTYYWTVESIVPQGGGNALTQDTGTARYTIKNTSIPKVSVTAKKDWTSEPNVLGAKAILFKLTQSYGEGDGKVEKEIGTAIASAANGFEVTWDNLDKYVNVLADPPVAYTYHVEETKVFFGEFDGDGNVPEDEWVDAASVYGITSDPADGDAAFGADGTATVSFTNTPATMDVNVLKKWVRPDGTTPMDLDPDTTATIQIKQIYATDSAFTQNTGDRILSFRIGTGEASADLTMAKNAAKYDAAVTTGDQGEYTLTAADAQGRDDWTLFIDGLQKKYVGANGTVYYCKYEVIEQELSGFTVQYSTHETADVHSVTDSGSTIEITNKDNGGKLTVTKTVTGAYAPTDNDAYPITIRYGEEYLNASGQLVPTDPGLTIKDKQTLTFDPVPSGQYTVSEGDASRAGYTVTTTYAASPGTAGETQAEATVAADGSAAVAITNHYRNAELIITKTIAGVAAADLAAVAGTVSFTVTNAEGTTVFGPAALTDGSFSADGTTYTAMLKSGDNALIVPDGTYTVTETTTDAQGYILASTTYTVTTGTPGAGNDSTAKTGSLQLTDEDTSHGRIDFTNTYTPAETTIDVIKKDGKTKEPLQGAEFKLTKLTQDGNTWTETDTVLVSGPTGTDGIVAITGLTTGRWRLAETKAPDGYLATPETIDIEVTVVNNQAVVTQPGTVQLQMIEFADGVITVKNSAGSELPSTGGSGTLIYTLSGLALVMLAAALLVIRRRKANRY